MRGSIIWLAALLQLAVLGEAGLANDGRHPGVNQWARSEVIGEQPIKFYSDGSITTPTFINRKGPFEFLVDTGAFMSAIRKSTVSASGLEHQTSGKLTVIGADGKKRLRLLKFSSLIVSVFEIRSVKLLELPGGFLPYRSPEKGILGTDFLASHTLAFDLDRNKIVFYPPSLDLTEGLPGYFDTFPIQFSRRDNGLFAKIHINGKKYTALVDTGANFTAINKALAGRLGIDTENGYKSTAVGIHGQQFEIYVTELESLKAGSREWKNRPIALMEMNKARSPWDAVVGMDFLGDAPFAIDYKRRRVLLVKPDS